MTDLAFQDLAFCDQKDKIIVSFLDIFYVAFAKKTLEKIAPFSIDKHTITFDCSPKRAEHKFNSLLSTALQHDLKNKITGRKTIYIHKDSGIPLIGTNYFGIVDRGSSLLELKPITGCNLTCCYCSVDEGPHSKTRMVDFVVEADYLIAETSKVIAYKGIDGIEIHIGCQGEPLLYKNLEQLITGLHALKQVSVISMDTNGVMLTEEKVDSLIKAGLNRFNVSLNAISQEIATKIAGTYSNEKVLKIAAYIAQKTSLILTPVWIFGMNDSEIPKILEFAKKLKASIGIQNFLCYKFGRNPVKEKSFEEFYAELKRLEKKYHVKLIHTAADFTIKPAKELPKPFKKGDTIDAVIMCEGRLAHEMLAVAQDRVIAIQHCTEKIGKRVMVRILRSKHNIFTGILRK